MFQPLSDVIRSRRLQRNLTQERLARLAGVSRRRLSLMEDGANARGGRPKAAAGPAKKRRSR